jgi:hypothetical protein
MASAEKKLSKAVIIRQLQQVCDEKQAEYNAVLLENQTLRTREVGGLMTNAANMACLGCGDLSTGSPTP